MYRLGNGGAHPPKVEVVSPPSELQSALIAKSKEDLDAARDKSREVVEIEIQLSGLGGPSQSSADTYLDTIQELTEEQHRLSREVVLGGESREAITRASRDLEQFQKRSISQVLLANERKAALETLADQTKESRPDLVVGTTEVHRGLSIDSPESLEAAEVGNKLRLENSYRPGDPRIWLYGGFAYARGKELLGQALGDGATLFRVNGEDQADLQGLLIGAGPGLACKHTPGLAGYYQYYGGAPAEGLFMGINPKQARIPVYRILINALNFEYAGVSKVAAGAVQNRNHRVILVHHSQGRFQLYSGWDVDMKSNIPHKGTQRSDFDDRITGTGIVLPLARRWREEFKPYQLDRRELDKLAEQVGDFGLGVPSEEQRALRAPQAFRERVSVMNLVADLLTRDEQLEKLSKAIQSGDTEDVLPGVKGHFERTLPSFWLHHLNENNFWDKWKNPGKHSELFQELSQISEQATPSTRALQKMQKKLISQLSVLKF